MKRHGPGVTLQFVRRCLREDSFAREARVEFYKRWDDRFSDEAVFESEDDFLQWMRGLGIVREERSG